MCGIAGILTARSDLDLKAISEAMQTSLRHRGPDDEGRVELSLPGGYRLSLVHTRLSILDLSAAGHQPMNEPDSGSWITFNGEIYNHSQIRHELPEMAYRSSCDTETILKSWDADGVRSLDALRGMFAFAVYDGRRRQVHLVRDRLGIKPLYVYQADASTWLFASEVRTLLASGIVPRVLNPVAVNSFLAFGAVTAPWTMIEGVQSVLPGEYWEFDFNEPAQPLVPRQRRWWSLRFAPRQERMSYGEALERLRPALIEALSLHMLSDVPVGVFLSGGIDSSSLVSLLTHAGHSLHTFTVQFGERDFDESEHAAQIARRFGTTHTKLNLSPTVAVDRFQSALSAYDQPSIDGVNTYFISDAVARAGIKVTLSGLGGDELFAGYATFRQAASIDRPLYRWVAQWPLAYLQRTVPGSARAQKLRAILNDSGTRLDRYAIFRQLMMPQRREALLEYDYFSTPTALPEETIETLKAAASRLDVVNSYSLFELSLYLADMLLRDADQMSMVHPVELRVPLLDHVLVETIASIPGPLKSSLWYSGTKQLLVDALPTHLPREISSRPKMGFVLPWELWLRDRLQEPITAILADRAALRDVAIRPEAVEQLWRDFRESRPGVRYTDILAIVHLLHWVREHRLAA
ncbi:MAG TPA: asparagine synthase (glutamine-hydrolyzing) [Pirellulales bacterium]|jgi:asparagine synthase (glutamine-hydrolysing)|nr:asparagine synthase (glutamine-hydrolyzing) [Pirellulales bacterium]